jgi:hypothetical protein
MNALDVATDEILYIIAHKPEIAKVSIIKE